MFERKVREVLKVVNRDTVDVEIDPRFAIYFE